MDYKTILGKASNLLKNFSIKNPRLDSELLLSKSLKISRENLLLNLNKKINLTEQRKFSSLLEKRKKKMPVAYILGYKDFWNSKFLVNNSVLIPRPDTEIIVAEALNYLPKKKSKKIIDIGTGSGCIIISVLQERPKSTGVGLDISKNAIKIAKINARLSKVIPKKIISCAQGAIKAHTDLGYDREKIVVIGNGYDLSTFNINSNSRSAIREELNIGKHPVLGMVGRYDPQKNHEGLLEALSLIKKQGYNFDLVLVGRDLNEKNKELLHKIKKLDLYDQVHLLDQRSDIPNIMNALDIHILSSSYGEGFPNVIAEAMACGTPCIATDIGDSAVIIGDSGWIVSENNSEELANAIIKGFQEKENEQKWAIKIKSARKRILDNFDIEIMVEKYNNVWKK